MKYYLKEYHLNIPDKVLIDDLSRTAKRLGKQKISRRQYREEGTYDDSTLGHRFGSWNKAVLKAGLEINRPATREELMNNLKQVWNKLKRQPSSKDMVKPLSKYSNYAYVWRFGSWTRALKIFIKLNSNHGKQYCGLLKTIPIRKRKKINGFNVSKSMRFDIMTRDNFRCRLCGNSPALKPGVILHVDHIIPRSKGGKSIPSNLHTLCDECNYGKGIKLMKCFSPEGMPLT